MERMCAELRVRVSFVDGIVADKLLESEQVMVEEVEDQVEEEEKIKEEAVRVIQRKYREHKARRGEAGEE